MNSPTPRWLLLVISLPSTSATARMRIWRALKALGCGALRDGAYLLPYTPETQQALQQLADETVREGGSAWLLTAHAQSDADSEAYRALFDRGGVYNEWLKEVSAGRSRLASMAPPAITKLMRKLRRDYDIVRAIDYFPNDAGAQAEAAWMDFVSAADSILSPDEPQPVRAGIARLDIDAYQGRTWATRRRLWVDRVASAWLIRRFIDRQARFLWLDAPAHCPADALGFDFDGAAFTHIGDKVSFEVLLGSFGLDQDRALVRLGALVHTLDVGDGFVPEASGFEAMLAGARQRTTSDDQLLAEVGVVLDSLYAHFSSDHPQTQGQA
ncbi:MULTISPECIES: chromate resistance protein ChrB domain-containing protein [unclassified Janthinobacterium]|uniref:chromate resistance protein ChrB domain-containing protein n=1 Tax=unclassified Janthinobacterium TaxID=2610881 RepID=UPI0004758714|nr:MULTISPECIES: chromate resistance protein ChrB domain-containing protein [unclassified Janthinobacterium]